MRISDWSSDVCSSDLANFLQVHFLDEIELQHHCLPLGKLTDAARQCLFQGIALQKVVGPILNVREPHALVGIDFVHAVMLGDFAAVHDLPVIGGRQSHFGRHLDRKSTRLNSSTYCAPRMQSSASKRKRLHY